MHKTLLSLALAVVAPLLAAAQDAPAGTQTGPPSPTTMPMGTDAPAETPDLTVGLKVFGGIAGIVGNDADYLYRSLGNGLLPLSSVATEQRFLATGGGGLTAHLRLGTAGWGVQTELLYALKGGQMRADNYRTNLFVHYVSLPVLARFNHGGLYAEAGPQLSYLIDASIEQTNQQGTPTNGPGFVGDAITNRREYNEVEWGYAVGLGYNFPSRLTLGLRYNAAVRPLLPKQAGTEVRAYNAGIEVHMGVLLGKKKASAALPMAPTGM